MKKLICYSLILSGLFLTACKRGNQYCECLDENLEHLKAHRLNNYKGEMEKSSFECQELQKKSVEEIVKIKGDKECPNTNELLEEKELRLKHSIKSNLDQIQKDLDNIQETLKPIEDKYSK